MAAATRRPGWETSPGCYARRHRRGPGPDIHSDRYSCVMDVNEASRTLGVTPRRVRALIEQGRIQARIVGGRWQIDNLDNKLSRGRRPLSSRSRSELAEAIRTRSLGAVSGQSRARAAARLRELRESSNPAVLISQWWPDREEGTDAFTRSLVANARAGNNGYIARLVAPRGQRYLRHSRQLSDALKTERAVRGLSQHDLATAAGIPVGVERSLERGITSSSPGMTRRALAAVGIEPTALPDMELS